MAEVSGQEAQVLEVLKNSGEYGKLPEKYQDAPELDGETFPDLRDREIITLYGTLAGVPAKETAEDLDVSRASISNYRSTLVEQNYLRNLQPGRGPSDYFPGLETIGMMEDYTPGIELFEDEDPARPLNGDEGLKWLIGEELYEQLSELEETERTTEEVEEAVDTSEIDVRLNGYAEEDVAKLLDLVESGETGFGPITDELGSDTAHSMADDLEGQGLLEEDQGEVSGLSLTGKGKIYLGSRSEQQESSEESVNVASSTRSRNRSSKSSSSSRRSSSRRTSNGKADEGLLRLGSKLLDGHEEEMSQEERTEIASRDLTESESEEVELEDNNAGYTGFT